MTRSSLSLLLLLAYPTAALAAPLAPAAEPPPLAPAPPLAPQTVAVRAPSPLPQLGLGALQLVGGYGVGIGGTLGLMEAGFNPKAYGARSDYANLVHVGALAPALAGGAVCGLGSLSRRYRGRCWTAVLGAYAGAVAGTLLGVLLAPAPGPDDTVEFSRAMSGIAGVMLFAPIGGVLGWHLGKQEVIEPVD